jgi:hypothetical protein
VPKKVIPLTGKWIPAYEGVDLGLNYKQLTNLRYTDTHLQGIGGMTKINTSVMHGTHQKVRSAFHYTKSQPAESHLLAQAYNSDLSASVILQNKTALPTPAFSRRRSCGAMPSVRGEDISRSPLTRRSSTAMGKRTSYGVATRQRSAASSSPTRTARSFTTTPTRSGISWTTSRTSPR